MTMNTIATRDFEAVEIRAGTILRVEPFPEAHRPAYKIWIGLGDDLGVKPSTARVTDNYEPDELVGMQVVCVTNFPPRDIGSFTSEVLVTGFYRDDGKVVLACPARQVPDGARLA